MSGVGRLDQAAATWDGEGRRVLLAQGVTKADRADPAFLATTRIGEQR